MSTARGRGSWAGQLAALLIGLIVFTSGVGVGVLAAPLSGDGIWSGDWIRESCLYVSNMLQLAYTTPGRLLIAGPGGNVTTDSGFQVNTATNTLTIQNTTFTGYLTASQDVNILGNLNVTGTSYLGATWLGGALDANGQDITDVDDLNATDAYVSNVYANTTMVWNGTAYENVTETLIYAESEADYIIWTDGATYYAKNGHTGEVTSNADASTIIQAQIDAAELIGGHVHIKNGLYPINALASLTSCLTIDTSNVTLTGGGWGTILQMTANQGRNVLEINSGASNIIIANIKIDQNKLAGGNTDPGDHDACAIRIRTNTPYSENIVIDKCFVFNAACNGILGTGNGLRYTNNYGLNCDSAGFEITGYRAIISHNVYYCNLGSTEHAYEANGGPQSIFSNNLAYDDLVADLKDGFYIWTSSNFCVIEGNNVRGCSRKTINIQSEACTITGNVFYSNIGTVSVSGHTIMGNIFLVGALTLSLNTPSNTVLMGNTFTNGASLILSSGNPTISRNPGYVTESSGSATLLSGQNHVHVPHGLSYTPSINDIHLTRTGPNSNCTALWVDPATITSTEFQVFCGTTSQKNTDANILFNWDSDKP